MEKYYRTILSEINNITFQLNNLQNRKKATWFVSILIKENRDYYLNEMEQLGIEVRPFFFPLSEMPIYKEYVFSSKISRDISKRGICLPTNYLINQEVISRIKDVLLMENK